jgi:hypothetical protein
MAKDQMALVVICIMDRIMDLMVMADLVEVMAEPEEESEILVTVPVVYMAAVEHHTLAEMVDMVMVVICIILSIMHITTSAI